MPILTNILQKAGKSPQQNKRQKSRKESKKGRPPAPVGRGKKNTETKETTTKAKEQPKKNPTTQQVATQNAHNAYQVIIRPHISEKSVHYKNQGKYIFEVFQHATANSVAQAVKKLYNTEVVKVQIMKVPNKGKRMRTKNIKGVSVRHNKAIVTIKKGQSIEVLPQ